MAMINGSGETTTPFDSEPLAYPEGLDPKRIPTFTQLPAGEILMEVKSAKSDNVGKEVSYRVVKAQLVIVDTGTGQYKGMPHTETFFLGSKADPQAKNPATWNANGRQLFKLFQKAKVAYGGGISFEQTLAALVGQQVGVVIREAKRGKDAGTNKIYDFFSPGEKPLRLVLGQANVGGDLDKAIPPNATTTYSNDD